MNFEDFHIVALKETSDRVADLLRSAGVRIQQRVITEIGKPEYVIAVHPDDVDRAGQAFSNDVGPGRTFTTDGT
jgi:hypothetical protein